MKITPFAAVIAEGSSLPMVSVRIVRRNKRYGRRQH